jgi:D-3-phosphoglycerate dehydrogenase
MADFKVVVTDYVLPNFDIEREMLEAVGAELVLGQCESAQQLVDIAVDADALINTYYGPLSDEVFAGCKKAKVCVRLGIGYDTFDLEAATRHGVMMANVPDYCLEEVSDHAIGLWLGVARRIPLMNSTVRTGDWTVNRMRPVANTRGQTVGIIGVGRIGSLVARKLSGFGVQLIYCDPYVEEASLKGVDCRKVELEELCRESDAIFVHALANEETHHLLNEARFKQMTKRPFIINTARAALIDEAALEAALEGDQIAGVGLDLVEGEQLPEGHPLLAWENVVLTPHVAWYSEDSMIALHSMATQEIIRVLEGGVPRSLLNTEVDTEARR